MPNPADEPLSDLDSLMVDDPLSLSDADIDRIIAYQRNQRAAREAGIKPRKAAKEGPKMTIDLKALGLIKEKPKLPVIKGVGIRRI